MNIFPVFVDINQIKLHRKNIYYLCIYYNLDRHIHTLAVTAAEDTSSGSICIPVNASVTMLLPK